MMALTEQFNLIILSLHCSGVISVAGFRPATRVVQLIVRSFSI